MSCKAYLEEIEKGKQAVEESAATIQKTTTTKATTTTKSTTTTIRSRTTTQALKFDQVEEDKSSVDNFFERPDVELIGELLEAFLNDEELTEPQVKSLKKVLLNLKIKAGKLSEKIDALEKILETSGNIANPSDKAEATNVLSVANCITVNIKFNI